MMSKAIADTESLFAAWNNGDFEARDALLERVYPELKLLASRYLAREAAGHTLNTTALVHEACFTVLGDRMRQWQGRAQFFAFMATVMRHILVNHARGGQAAKRQGGRLRVPLHDELKGENDDPTAILDLESALLKLTEHAPRLAQVAECRIFGGLSDAEVAEALAMSERTAARDWQRARAWLRVALREAYDA
jgi:RNA polymerase sigma-70 factor, ECF subfamily